MTLCVEFFLYLPWGHVFTSLLALNLHLGNVAVLAPPTNPNRPQLRRDLLCGPQISQRAMAESSCGRGGLERHRPTYNKPMQQRIPEVCLPHGLHPHQHLHRCCKFSRIFHDRRCCNELQLFENSGLSCCSGCFAVLCHNVSVRFCRPRCWVYPFRPNHFARLSSCLASIGQTKHGYFSIPFCSLHIRVQTRICDTFRHTPSGDLDVGAPIVFAPGGQDNCKVCEQNLCYLSLEPKRVARKTQYQFDVWQNLFSQYVPPGVFVCIVARAVDSFKTRWTSDLFRAMGRNHHPGPRTQIQTQRSELGQGIFHSHPSAGAIFFEIIGLHDASRIHFEKGLMRIELQSEALRQCRFRNSQIIVFCDRRI